MLERRLTRLENKLKVPKEERHVCEGSLAKSESIRIEGVRVQHSALVLDRSLKVVGKPKLDALTQVGGSTQAPLPWTQQRLDGNMSAVKPEVRFCSSFLQPLS